LDTEITTKNAIRAVNLTLDKETPPKEELRLN